jgi:hypothetical protein
LDKSSRLLSDVFRRLRHFIHMIYRKKIKIRAVKFYNAAPDPTGTEVQ